MAKLTYKNAGVDIVAGDRFVKKITPMVRSTFRPEVLTDLGGFAGLFSLGAKKFKDPVLVAGTDGVGTKLKVACMADCHDTVGIDLVAMCVNDLVVTGAEPLFFLDYFATGRLEQHQAVQVLKGIVKGCRQSGAALIGGETAEMPSFYAKGEYDLAGFAVGIVERKSLVDGSRIRPGDLLVGLPSSGIHSNGFSLVRKIFFEKEGFTVHDRLPGFSQTLGKVLLTPTTIYVKTILRLLKEVSLKGMAHITGGGITENLPRILPTNCTAKIHRDAWTRPLIFKMIQEKGNLDEQEMFIDFNMGIGMILVIGKKDQDRVFATLKQLRQRAFLIGEVVQGKPEVSYV